MPWGPNGLLGDGGLLKKRTQGIWIGGIAIFLTFPQNLYTVLRLQRHAYGFALTAPQRSFPDAILHTLASPFSGVTSTLAVPLLGLLFIVVSPIIFICLALKWRKAIRGGSRIQREHVVLVTAAAIIVSLCYVGFLLLILPGEIIPVTPMRLKVLNMPLTWGGALLFGVYVCLICAPFRTGWRRSEKLAFLPGLMIYIPGIIVLLLASVMVTFCLGMLHSIPVTHWFLKILSDGILVTLQLMLAAGFASLVMGKLSRLFPKSGGNDPVFKRLFRPLWLTVQHIRQVLRTSGIEIVSLIIQAFLLILLLRLGVVSFKYLLNWHFPVAFLCVDQVLGFLKLVISLILLLRLYDMSREVLLSKHDATDD